MSIVAEPQPPTTSSPMARRRAAVTRLNGFDRRANAILKWVAIAGAALVFLIMIAVFFTIVDHAQAAIGKYGFKFLISGGWDPVAGKMGAGPLIYGTIITSVVSVTLAGILGVSIGLFLALMAPKAVGGTIGPLVEMLAAVPSVVFGTIGLIVVSPFVAKHIEPAMHSVLGFIPLFGSAQPTGTSIFLASLVLTFMVLPIISSLTRDVILTVPQELSDGAAALGATRWEVIRGIVLPTTASGIISACVLGFGRALGEAIAVTLVIGGQTAIHSSLYKPGDSLASRIASQFESPVSPLHLSTLYYCALVLLVFGILTNVMAARIARRTQTH